jgi:hypothetical protein
MEFNLEAMEMLVVLAMVEINIILLQLPLIILMILVEWVGLIHILMVVSTISQTLKITIPLSTTIQTFSQWPGQIGKVTKCKFIINTNKDNLEEQQLIGQPMRKSSTTCNSTIPISNNPLMSTST